MIKYPDRVSLISTIAPNSRIAEIGTQRGDFAECLLATRPSLLVLVDLWRHQSGSYESDLSNIDDGGHASNMRHVIERFDHQMKAGRVELVQGFSTDAADRFDDGFFDVVYVDANHTYDAVLADLEAWAPKIKEGGRLMGHDYTTRPEALAQGFGVVEAVEKFCTTRGWAISGLTQDDWPSYELTRK